MKNDLSNVIPIASDVDSNLSRKEAIQNPLASKDTPPEMWVQIYLRLNHISYDYKTSSLRQNGEPLEYKALISMMRLYANNLKVEKLSYYFKDAMTIWMRDQSETFLCCLRDSLKYQPTKAEVAKKWVLAVTGEARHIDVAVLRHWIWQVKRKIFGLPVEHHMMPVLFGKSGGGKSVAVHKLLKPVKDVTLLQNMTVFNDQFARRMFARNFVMFFDEMGKSKQVDIDCMKNLITAPTVEWRGIQSEAINSAKQNCTFIAASNDPLIERIQDPTSARRFWQFDCADRLDWGAINNIDYFELWKSIDENMSSPIGAVIDLVKEYQKEHLQQKDLVEIWIKSTWQDDSLDAKDYTTSQLFKAFTNWCLNSMEVSQMSFQRFSKHLPKKLEELKLKVESRHAFNGTTWKVSIKQ